MNGIVTSIETFSRELVERGHEICIIVPKNAWVKQFSCPWVEILAISGLPALFYPEFKLTFAFTPRILRKVLTFKPDIIHFHTQFVLGWQAILFGKFLQIPRIGTFHTYITDEWYLEVLGLPNYQIFWKISWKYNNFFYKNIEHVIAPSRNAHQELIAHGIDRDRITIVPNPINLDHTQGQHTPTKNIFLDGLESIHTLLYVWRISREKSLTVSLDALVLVKEIFPDVCLIIVGDGPEREEIEKYITRKNLSDNVLFLGSISHDRLMYSDIFSRSSLFITASTSETQGITLLEAMSFSLPIVGVDAKWVGEIIENNGFKTEPHNAYALAESCIKILSDPHLRATLGNRSRKIVEKYDVHILTPLLEKLYRKVLVQKTREKKLKSPK